MVVFEMCYMLSYMTQKVDNLHHLILKVARPPPLAIQSHRENIVGFLHFSFFTRNEDTSLEHIWCLYHTASHGDTMLRHNTIKLESRPFPI